MKRRNPRFQPLSAFEVADPLSILSDAATRHARGERGAMGGQIS